MREAEDQDEFELPLVTSWRAQTAKGTKAESRPGQAATVFALLAITFMLLAIADLPMSSGSSAAARVTNTAPEASKSSRGGGLRDILGGVIRSRAPITLKDDFRAGLSHWEGLRTGLSDWSLPDGSVRPTKLRVWKESTSLSNYEMEFMGHIEKKSMDWAFRAADMKNYYATKLTIARPGSYPNAGLVRFLVLDGRERERVELPLPLTLERNTDYRVRVSVAGDHFLTSVNGQLVSSWTDTRLARGGIGFFSDDGESAVVKWVTLSERDSLLGRIVSHFSLFMLPPPLPPA
ncbi:MAG: hypothetical protein M3O35_03475 [Acidobacteriota bacterium]|nr:hypothetical protein [Acidobacteriota bacterium]